MWEPTAPLQKLGQDTWLPRDGGSLWEEETVHGRRALRSRQAQACATGTDACREVSKGATGAAGGGGGGVGQHQGRWQGRRSRERRKAETGGRREPGGSVSCSAALLLRGPQGSAVTPLPPLSAEKEHPRPFPNEGPRAQEGSRLPKTMARHGHRQDTTQDFGAGPAGSTHPRPLWHP